MGTDVVESAACVQVATPACVDPRQIDLAAAGDPADVLSVVVALIEIATTVVGVCLLLTQVYAIPGPPERCGIAIVNRRHFFRAAVLVRPREGSDTGLHAPLVHPTSLGGRMHEIAISIAYPS